MNIDEAIKEFKSNAATKYSHADISLIKAVVDELGVVEFEIYSTTQKLDLFIRDLDNNVHIHPTMIVSKLQFSGSTIPSNYTGHPYIVTLDDWSQDGIQTKQKTDVSEVFCNERFIWIPVGVECQCGKVHELDE